MLMELNFFVGLRRNKYEYLTTYVMSFVLAKVIDRKMSVCLIHMY